MKLTADTQLRDDPLDHKINEEGNGTSVAIYQIYADDVYTGVKRVVTSRRITHGRQETSEVYDHNGVVFDDLVTALQSAGHRVEL